MQQYSYFFILILVGICICDEQTCVDEVKQNHNRKQAITLYPFQVLKGIICSKNEEDWFRVPLKANEQNGILLLFNDSLGQLDIQLFQEGSTRNASSEQNTNVEGIGFYNPKLTESTGYVRVYFRKYPVAVPTIDGELIYLEDPDTPFIFPEGGIPYTFLAENPSVKCSKTFDNHEKETAHAVTESTTLGMICQGENDTDYYILKGLKAGDKIDANVAYIHAVCRCEIDLLDAEGNILVASPNTLCSKSVSFNVENDGDYYLKLYGEGHCHKNGGHYILTVNEDVLKEKKIPKKDEL